MSEYKLPHEASAAIRIFRTIQVLGRPVKSEILEATSYSPQVLTKHIGKMKDDGFLVSEGCGAKANYSPTELGIAWAEATVIAIKQHRQAQRDANPEAHGKLLKLMEAMRQDREPS